ncbi:MAG TPA: SDR family oxidoreductase, partial [Myxococcota bacterium]|nr:SDR family oxidoreductase [Myxococcota bacterium]
MSNSKEGSKSVLVTGATGFLGRHLLQTLTRDGRFGKLIVLVRDRREWDRYTWAREIANVE